MAGLLKMAGVNTSMIDKFQPQPCSFRVPNLSLQEYNPKRQIL